MNSDYFRKNLPRRTWYERVRRFAVHGLWLAAGCLGVGLEGVEGAGAGAGGREFRAGAAVVDVTPTNYPVLVNAMFTERTATNAVDRLFTRALVLDDGATRLALAVVDSCMVPRDLMDRAKSEASGRTGIPVERMMISATHTHSAPSAMGCLGSRADTNYQAFLPGRMAEAIVQAAGRLKPAKVGWISVEDWEHTFNRRWIRRPDRLITDPFGQPSVRAQMHPGHQSPDAIGPSGPVDPELSILAVQSEQGEPVALLANYSQHYYGSPLLSSDYYGRYCQHLARLLGAENGGFVGIMSQGTSGDLMWMDYSAPARDIGYDKYALELAQRTLEAYRKIQWQRWVPLKMAERVLPLEYRVPDANRLAWARGVAESLKGRLPRTHPEIYALEAIYLHERPRTELKLQAIGIGELGIAAIPNEVYALTGLKLKRQSPFPQTFNVELANGAEGYIPPPEQHVLGGYTTWPARTAGLEVEAEPRIVETLLALLEETSGRKRRVVADTHGAYAKAILDSKPAAYWRLNEMTVPVVADASGNRRNATLEKGVAVYLPGADNRIGFQPPKPEVPNAFSGGEINRAAHFAGGRLRSDLRLSEGRYSVEFWFWNGLANDVRPVTGYLFSRGVDGDLEAAGEHLGIGGLDRSLGGRLVVFNGNQSNQILSGKTQVEWRKWHHVVLVRADRKVRLYLNGELDLEGDLEQTARGMETRLFMGGRSDGFAPFEGKIDEVAVYDRELRAGEVEAHYKVSGVSAAKGKQAVKAMVPLESEPLSPEESMKRIRVTAGYEVDLVAAEPLLESPVAMDWDGQGRLWVVEMVDYPSGMDGQGKAGGRVRILEDTNRDGRYDKTTLFAEGLPFPTGILCWRDGALITAAPEIVFLKDSDGDGKAEERQVLFSGFLEGNQQLRVNGLRWGLDNWVHCAIGAHYRGYGAAVKIKSHRTGAEIALGSRDFRFRPDTGELEPQSGPSQFGRNPDDWGNWFGVQNSWPLWHYVLEEQYVRRNPHVAAPDPVQQVIGPKNPRVFPISKPEKRFHSFNESGHFTSACAAQIYRDDLLFGKGNGVMHSFTCEPFHNLVHHGVIEKSGVSFKGRRAAEEQESEFFASADRWCRPVMTRTGPDGALWVVDMYRYMIEHPEWLPPEGREELLPHYRAGEERGRIYRVYPRGRKPMVARPLDELSIEELVRMLESSNGWQRDKAQMMLIWKRDERAPELLENLARTSGSALARVHALCTLDGLGVLKPELVARGLGDSEPGVRMNALRLAERVRSPEVLEAGMRLAQDADLRVRLQLACTLGEWEGQRAGETLGRLLVEHSSDHYILAGVMSSAVPHAEALVAAASQGSRAMRVEVFEPLLNLAQGMDRRDLIAQLLEPVLRGEEGAFTIEQMDQFRKFLELLGRKRSTLAQAMEGPKGGALRALSGAMSELYRAAHEMAREEKNDGTARLAAAALLSQHPDFRGAGKKVLAELITPRFAGEVQRGAIERLAMAGEAGLGDLVVRAWPSLDPATRSVALDQVLGREEWALALLDGVRSGAIHPGGLDAARRGRFLRHGSAQVRNEAGELLGTDRPTRAAVVKQYAPAVEMKGEAKRGGLIAGRLCVTCHRVNGQGVDIGPALASVAHHAPEKLLSSILDPNMAIEPGYLAYTCRMANGEEVYGIITAETGNSLIMKTADGKERAILRGEIAALDSANVSLMPEGLEMGLSAQELADLIEFVRAQSVTVR